jgi:Mobilization protein NikA
MKTIRLDLDRISETRFRRRLERLRAGRPLKFREVRPRDPEKRRLLLAFNLRTSPPARDILSGRAFRKLLAISSRPGPKRGTRTVKEPKSRIIPVRMTEAQYRNLAARAKARGVSISDLIRKVLGDGS